MMQSQQQHQPSLESDTEFDAYWEEEARNPHRNRIRIGRQYQASIPPRLKSGEGDGRKIDQLETLAWRKENGLNDEKLDDYFFTSRALGLIARFRAKNNNAAATPCDSSSASSSANKDSTPNSATTTTSDSRNGICASSESSSSSSSTSTSSRPGPKSRKEMDERKALLTAELVNLANFVTSHHPESQDAGCHCKGSEVKSEKWSINEARLFAHALENYGKNFATIKKIMPWKTSKGLMEHYYKKIETGDSDPDEVNSEVMDMSPNNNQETSGSSPTIGSKNDFTTTTTLQVSHFTTSNERFDGNLPINWKRLNNNCNNNEITGGGQQKRLKSCASSKQLLNSSNSNSNNSSNNSDLNGGADMLIDPAPPKGAEIKPVRAKPVFPTESTSSELSLATNGQNLSQQQQHSLLGSLKFFMDGQLVLKLNANQDASSSEKKCHWVESQDTPKIVKSVRNKKYKNAVKSRGNGSATESSSTGSSATTGTTGAASCSGSSSSGSSGGGSGVAGCETSSRASEETGDDDEESSDDSNSTDCGLDLSVKKTAKPDRS